MLLIEEMGGEVKSIHGEDIKFYESIRKENLLAVGNNKMFQSLSPTSRDRILKEKAKRLRY